MKRVLQFVFTTFLFFSSSLSFAATYTFNGNGSWDDSKNWIGGLIPPLHATSDIIITGNVTYTSGLVLNPGSTLTISNGATLTLQADPFSGGGGLWFDGATITVQSGGTFYCWDWIYLLGNLNIDGIMWCSSIEGTGPVLGAVTINGTFEVGGPGQFFGLSKPIIVNNGGIFHLRSGCYFGSTNTLTINNGGTFNNEGIVRGNVTIITNDFSNAGTLSPGNSPGIITINGDYSPSSSANHIIELGGTSAGNFDKITVSGNVVLNGALNASLIGGFNPSGNHDIVILTANSISGSFSSVNLPSGYSIIYNSNNVTLRFGGVLPVTFVNIDVRKDDNASKLTWKIADERDVINYDIEKSLDGIRFSKIGSVYASGQTVYSFRDERVQAKNFYRIKSIDLDGKFRYSGIVSFNQGKALIVLKVFPVPAQNEITIQHSTAGTRNSIIVISSDGIVVKNLKADVDSQQTSIMVTELKAGWYSVSYDDGNGNKATIKILKQ